MQDGQHTPARTPPARPSDEGDRQQLDLARKEGAAYAAELRYMVDQVADTGGEQRAGDFVIAFAQEKAEGMYHLRGPGQLEWMEPEAAQNCHLEVSVRDAADDRFVPFLTVRATLTREDGPQAGAHVGPVDVPFLWHPGLYHYGRDLELPGDGQYTLRVEVDAPTFARHDKVNGKRYAEAVTAEFRHVQIKTGRE